MPPPLRWHFPFPPAFSPPQWCLVPRMSFWACCVGSAAEGLGRDLRVRDLWELEVDLAIIMVWRGWLVEDMFRVKRLGVRVTWVDGQVEEWR